jgi:RNA polymerase sigma factor (TIGR02999 family)
LYNRLAVGRSLKHDMSDVTKILSQIETGDPSAAEQLLPLVYDELRKLAAAKLAHETPGQTLQATALVHEAYLRLVGGADVQQWNSRGHFFAAAGEAMRRILVDQARRRKAAKRGGEAQREELDGSEISASHPIEELLAVDELLDRLAEIDPAAANLVKLRFFVGLNMSEVAEAMGVSVRTAHDIWAYARTWLHQKIAAE